VPRKVSDMTDATFPLSARRRDRTPRERSGSMRTRRRPVSRRAAGTGGRRRSSGTAPAAPGRHAAIEQDGNGAEGGRDQHEVLLRFGPSGPCSSSERPRAPSPAG